MATTALTPQFDVTISKLVDDETPQPGETVTYTIGLSNSGPSTATNVVLTDDIPAGLTFSNGSITGGGAASVVNGDVVFPGITLADDATATATLSFVVGAAASGNITNTATVTADNGETNLNNNSAQEVITVTPQVDITVAKTVDQAAAQVGDTLVYSIIVTNNGPDAALNVIATDTLPPNVTFVSGTGPNGALSASNGVVTVNGGTIASGGTFQFTINGTIDQGTTATQTNTVTVATDTAETNLANNSAQAATTIITPQADITVTKTVDQAVSRAGGSLVYSITVTNNGPDAAANVIATDTLPTNVTFASGTGPNGALTATNGVVTVNGGTLASGASFQFTINGTIDQGTTATQTNVVNVATDTAETNLANNSAQAATTIDPVLSSIAGTVYVDANNNGTQDLGEVGIAGVTLTLSGADNQGTPVSATTTTDANGDYIFANLAAGTYQVNETQPNEFRDGQESVGTVSAVAGDDVFTQLGLGANIQATEFDFGELTEGLSKRRFLASS